MRRSQTRGSQRGATFVVTLAILTAMVALVSAFAATSRTLALSGAQDSERLRARMLAQSGIARAMADLADLAQTTSAAAGGTSGATTAVPGSVTTLADDWATLGQQGGEEFTLANGGFRVQVVDASGGLPLNTADETTLLNLGLTQEQADSLLDWREPGQAPRALGAKDQYYNGLTEPYNARLAPLQSVDELLLVKGFTPQALYDPGYLGQNTTATQATNLGDAPLALADLATVNAYAPNVKPNGDARTNVNRAGLNADQLQRDLNNNRQLADAIITAVRGAQGGGGAPGGGQPGGAPPRGGGIATMGALLQRVPQAANPANARLILDNLTTQGLTRLEGRVNFNTATVQVLAALPGIGPDLAQTIVSRQQSQPFTKLSDLLDVSTDQAFVRTVADFASVASQSFEVRAVGKVGSVQVALVAVVVLENDAPRILRITEPPYADMPTRWNWTDPTITTSLQEANSSR